ncbi:TetR/AcrR family transcriptional regulator [Superficieibacter sp. HKU1]|uniref:TetR/AcrR family transcriptional regulator n=1 Tax=Superficieibacter sp. HKU1 TaxID=3031919 RepID=UPI0023E15A11|nr:TetR/AcrR family transcriptional regulator [Superficieibacter sp. HKU1]WES67835.1 TetR/AcrR family transcriptional regulator [Superficieibacter sp. HKU1]
MSTAHKREKNPAGVRKAIIEHAAQMAINHGVHTVTIQAVADAVPVTKGGVMHHFPTKKALLDALFEDLADHWEAELNRHISAHLSEIGILTRAYIEVSIPDETSATDKNYSFLALVAIGSDETRYYLSERFQRLLERHRHTDNFIELATVRYAAEGYWISQLTDLEPRSHIEVKQHLLKLVDAYKDSKTQHD